MHGVAPRGGLERGGRPGEVLDLDELERHHHPRRGGGGLPRLGGEDLEALLGEVHTDMGPPEHVLGEHEVGQRFRPQPREGLVAAGERGGAQVHLRLRELAEPVLRDPELQQQQRQHRRARRRAVLRGHRPPGTLERGGCGLDPEPGAEQPDARGLGARLLPRGPAARDDAVHPAACARHVARHPSLVGDAEPGPRVLVDLGRMRPREAVDRHAVPAQLQGESVLGQDVGRLPDLAIGDQPSEGRSDLASGEVEVHRSQHRAAGAGDVHATRDEPAAGDLREQRMDLEDGRRLVPSRLVRRIGRGTRSHPAGPGDEQPRRLEVGQELAGARIVRQVLRGGDGDRLLGAQAEQQVPLALGQRAEHLGDHPVRDRRPSTAEAFGGHSGIGCCTDRSGRQDDRGAPALRVRGDGLEDRG